MLNLTIRPGECLVIGEDVKVVITGGTQNNYHVMVEAPKSMNIVRGSVLEKKVDKFGKRKAKKYYVDKPLTKEDIDRLKAVQAKKNNFV